MTGERAMQMALVSSLIETADAVRELLAREYPHPHMVHVVVPDPRADRVPWMEVRLTWPAKIEIEELLAETWPKVDFELIWTDEEDL